MPCCPDRFLRSGQYCSCFYLGITRTEAFLMASSTSYHDVRSMALVDLLCFVAYHLRTSCCLCAVTFQSLASSYRIELVAQGQHPASFIFSRSDLLWFALILRVGIISARLGLADGLDDPVA